MMVSLTFNINEDVLKGIKKFPWVNWSEVAREEIMKKEIFERYMETKKVTDEDWKFCENIDWHPVDELPIKEEYLKELKKIKEQKGIKFDSVEEIFK